LCIGPKVAAPAAAYLFWTSPRGGRKEGQILRRCPLLLASLLALTPVLPASAEASLHDRIYLLGADTDYLHWSVDPTDPELAMSTIVRQCGLYDVWGVPEQSKPCLSSLNGANRTFNIFFLPGSLLDQPVTWNAASPLRFHVEARSTRRGSRSRYISRCSAAPA
jgi:hypothetical protein